MSINRTQPANDRFETTRPKPMRSRPVYFIRQKPKPKPITVKPRKDQTRCTAIAERPQGALVLAKSESLALGDNILRTL